MITTGSKRKIKQSSKRMSDQATINSTSTVVIQNSVRIKSAFCTFNKGVFKSLSGNPVAKNFAAYILAQQDQIMDRVKDDKMNCRV